jgi:ribosomal protein S27AE
MALQQQVGPLQQKLSQFQEELAYKDRRIQELKEPKAVMPSTLAQQRISAQPSSISSAPSITPAPSFATAAPSPTAATGRRLCPNCGASGFAIKEIEDKTKIVSYIPKVIYGKKNHCTKCGYEF